MKRHHVVRGKLRHLHGWNRNRPDARDLMFMVPDEAVTLPKAAGPKRYRPQIEDQGQEGSCTANSGTSVMELLRNKAGLPAVQFSRQGLYYSTRVEVEGGDPGEDSGAQIRDVMKALVRIGVGLEEHYPYTPDNFSRTPPPEYYAEAAKHKLLRYNHCPTVNAIKTMLALDYPVQFGFSVPDEMMSADFNGYLPMPEAGFAGGHAVYTDWYDDDIVVPGTGTATTGAFLCVNSWGKEWGLVGDDAGCFWLPYGYFEQGLASDACSPRLEAM